MTNIRKRQTTDLEGLSNCWIPRLTEFREAIGAKRAGSDSGDRPNSGCTSGYPSGSNRSREHGCSAVGSDDGTYATYADEEYGYRIVYPASWSVEAEPTGGVSFGASGANVAGAVVFVDEKIGVLDEYVETFMDALRADEHVHALEPATRRDVRLESGQLGQIIECPYVSDSPEETWRLMYLFTVVGGIGYTVGVDWNDADPLRGSAALIVGSFAVEKE